MVWSAKKSTFHGCILSPEYYGVLMKAALYRCGSSRGIFLSVLSLVAVATFSKADQVEMKNGDHYTGKVTSLDASTMVLESDVLGAVRLRRDQVSTLSFGTKQTTTPSAVAVPKPPAVPAVAATNPNAAQTQAPLDPNASLRQIAANQDLVSQIQSQVLAGAGPEATKKFNNLVGGLSTGNLNLGDLRKEAASVAAQLRQLRNNGDDESGAIFDDYLAILDNFLQETKTAVPPVVAPPVKLPAAKAIKPYAPAPAKPVAVPKSADQ